MKVRLTEDDRIEIDLSTAEARVLLEELSDVRGGSKLPKLRQVCHGLQTLLAFTTTSKFIDFGKIQ